MKKEISELYSDYLLSSFCYIYMIKIVIYLVLLFPVSLSFSGEINPLSISSGLYIDADKQFDFAEEYFSKGEYLKAISEYERFIFFFPKDKRVKEAMHQIGMTYYESKQFNNAIDSFNELIEKYGESDISGADTAEEYMMISECYVKMSAFEQAVSNLHYLLTLINDKDIADETYYRIGWIYLEKGESRNARNYFEKIDDKNKEKYRLSELYAGLETESLIPGKNPALAGVLSLIPGGGFFYCERYYDALTAFLLNSLLIYAAYESFDKDMNALGGLISLVETGFYTGNIYGGITGAHKYNSKRFTDRLKKSMRISISPYNKNSDFLFSFHFDF